ncbi:hypothetical protein KSF78_0004212 [Schistosoma japonicum]|nr:hypothetical protein KSF78_0004212 [Schistosoma japonicum]
MFLSLNCIKLKLNFSIIYYLPLVKFYDINDITKIRLVRMFCRDYMYQRLNFFGCIAVVKFLELQYVDFQAVNIVFRSIIRH